MSWSVVSYEFNPICHRCGKYKRTTESQEWISSDLICSCPPETTAVTPYAQGWVCPKCGRVNAPWVSCCPCWWPAVTISNSTNFDAATCDFTIYNDENVTFTGTGEEE